MSDDELLRRVKALERDNARLRSLLDRQGSTAGLRHQIKNTLAMVRDVVRRSAEIGDTVENYAAHLEGRLDAVFRVQTIIAHRFLDGIGLHSLLTDELMVHTLSRAERLSIDGPDVLLHPPAASTLALAFHELTTNAIKFGAFSVPEGRLAVTWSVGAQDAREPLLVLRWVESGMTLPTSQARRGFGTDVIEHAVPYHLSGRTSLDLTPTGLHCTFHLPMTPALGSVQAMRDGDATDDEPSRD